MDSGDKHLYVAGPETVKRWDLGTGAVNTTSITGTPAAISASTPAGAAFVALPDEDRVARFAVR